MNQRRPAMIEGLAECLVELRAVGDPDADRAARAGERGEVGVDESGLPDVERPARCSLEILPSSELSSTTTVMSMS